MFECVGENEVIFNINDVMEFLYMYMWGEEVYVYEIQEQFGIFMLLVYENCICEVFGEQVEIIELEYFFQVGYIEVFEGCIVFMKEDGQFVFLLDSICFFVIEKKKGLVDG